MSKSNPTAPRGRGQQLRLARTKHQNTPPPTLCKPSGQGPNPGLQRSDELGRKAAARAFLERAGKRGKAPPLIRRR